MNVFYRNIGGPSRLAGPSFSLGVAGGKSHMPEVGILLKIMLLPYESQMDDRVPYESA
jgi:hypothetical protein